MTLPSAIFRLANAAASGKSGAHAANLAAHCAGTAETSISRIRIKSEARDLQYIVGARLKELPKDLKERILDLAVYQPTGKLTRKLGRNAHPAQAFSGRGFRLFIKIERGARLEVDEKKIEEAARWDGLKGFVTNAPNMGHFELFARYRELGSSNISSIRKRALNELSSRRPLRACCRTGCRCSIHFTTRTERRTRSEPTWCSTISTLRRKMD